MGQDILLNLLFAGHETTASVVLTLLRQLPRHPHVMAQLRTEQDKVPLLPPPPALCFCEAASTYILSPDFTPNMGILGRKTGK